MTFTKPAARAARSFLALGLGVLMGLTPAVAQQSQPASPTGRSAVVRQTTLLVEDIDRTLEFYMRLGLTKVSDNTYEEGNRAAIFTSADLPLTADPKTSRLVVIKGSGDPGGMIGLLSYDRPRLSSARGNLSGLGTGDIIITVEVADMQETYKRLSQLGTRFQRLPYRATVTGSDGSERTIQRMLAFDPDGHLAEVIQPAK